MRNAAAMLYCSNPNCQAANSEEHQFCQKCSTPLPHRYLWAVGEGAAAYQAGEIIAERYLCKQPRIFLDTKPGLLSNTYQEPLESSLPYLRLTSYPLHIPELYDWIPATGAAPDLILLDRAPLDLTTEPQAAIQLLPTLVSQWQHASPVRQLNWLWQITTLWQPLSSENAAATLLDLEQLRVEGTLVRLLELRLATQQPSLVDLGHLWLQWAKSAQPEIVQFLTKICQGLIQGQIYNTELLLGYLDGALARLSQAQLRSVEIATLSDQGPTRPRNEDACYPRSGTHTPASDQALLIVCDGIGGHQGGDVASHLAITTLEERLSALDLSRLDSTTLGIELEKAVCTANDQISARNDNEHRFERQRMGTTVVMALARAHELYITHVGDSRAYWINRYGCHQITLDDDVASREVRLGYSFYRQALHQPSAGSLVQALGMGTSTMLYPSVQRFIPDEDTVFLLCSDGLSDNDQVEAAWQEIVPLLDGKAGLDAVSRRLVEIGNTRNGYDNVTVGLIYYRISSIQPLPTLTELPPLSAPTKIPTANQFTTLENQPTELAAPAGFSPASSASATATPTVPVEPRQPKENWLLLIGIGMLIGVAGLVTVLLLPTLRSGIFTSNAPLTESPTPTVVPNSEASPAASPTASPPRPLTLDVGTIVQVTSPSNNPLVLVSRPPGQNPSPSATPNASPAPLAASPAPVGQIPVGSVLEVLRKQSLSQQESWVELRVCSIAEATPTPTTSTPATPTPATPTTPSTSPAISAAASLQPGQTGWIREAEILPQVSSQPNIAASQRSCL
jgi:serine/threonine protein phosphatase PrpC